jgi:general secretion pathway protein D
MKNAAKLEIVFFLIALWLSGCVSNLTYQKADEAFKNKNWDEAIEYYQKALQADPKNPRIRLYLAKAYIYASNRHYESGESYYQKGDPKLALLEFQKAIDIYPENQRAREKKNKILKDAALLQEQTREKTELQTLSERMDQVELPKEALAVDNQQRFDLKFRDALFHEIINTLQKAGGVNIILDETVPNKPVSIEISNVTFMQAFESLVLANNLFYKIIDEKNIILIPDNPQKRQQYNELFVRTFYPSHVDVKELQPYLKGIVKIDSISINAALNSITLRDTYGKVKIAEKIIKALDKPKGDILVDIEIIEVNKRRMKEYGLDLSNYQLAANVYSDKYSEIDVLGGDEFSGLTAANLLFSIPSVIYKLMSADTKSKIIANPQVRVKANEQAQVKVGDKVPIPITSFVPWSAGGVPQQPITSFQYENVGINIEITPTLHLDSTITLKTNFELSFITIAGSETLPPTIGNRTVSSVIRLRDGETNVLAGLLRDEERKSLTGIPGLVKIPVLSSLFGSNSTEINQTDIIFTITPRILSFPPITESDLSAFSVGAESDLAFKSTAPPKEKTEESGDKKAKEKEDKDVSPLELKSPPQPKKPRPAESGPLILAFRPEQTLVPENTDFSVDVLIDNLGSLREASFIVQFDPNVVQATSIDEDFLKIKDAKILKKSIDNSKGALLISMAKGKETVLPGEGVLFRIWFKPIRKGRTPLHLSEIHIFSHSGGRMMYRQFNGDIAVE